jgi:hypothetical protein
MVTDTAGAGVSADEKLPPITELTVASMALIVVGGIYLASYLPKVAPLGPAIGLLCAALAPLGATLYLLTRLRRFAWPTFFLVGRYALLAYVVIAGMLEYIFVVDGTRGGTLVVLSLMLAVYALDIPVILAFSVARYQPPT